MSTVPAGYEPDELAPTRSMVEAGVEALEANGQVVSQEGLVGSIFAAMIRAADAPRRHALAALVASQGEAAGHHHVPATPPLPEEQRRLLDSLGVPEQYVPRRVSVEDLVVLLLSIR